MRVTKDQEKRLRGLLAFANLKSIRSLSQVAKLIGRHEMTSDATSIELSFLNRKDYSNLGVKAAIQNSQEELKKWLEAVARMGPAASKNIGGKIARLLNQAVPAIEFIFDGARLHERVSFKGYDLEAWKARGVMLILSDRLGLTNRLGRCNWCGQFRLDLSGKPRTYCNDKHRLAYDRRDAKERVKRWRNRTTTRRREK